MDVQTDTKPLTPPQAHRCVLARLGLWGHGQQGETSRWQTAPRAHCM